MTSTFDFSSPGWGENVVVTETIDKGKIIKICGWTKHIQCGDYLILRNATDVKGISATTRYKVDEIDYYADPPDMFNAVCSFAPRQNGD